MKLKVNREKREISITMSIEEADIIADRMSIALQEMVGSAPDADCAEQYSLNEVDEKFTKIVEEANRRLKK